MLSTLHDFFPGSAAVAERCPDLRVRVAKLGDQYASQVWAETGFWLVGHFATRERARREALALIATEPVEPAPDTPRAELPPNWVRRRSDAHTPRYKWVRWIPKGANTWQARPHLGPGKDRGALNLGLFTFEHHGDNAEWAAAQVSKAFMRLWIPGRTVGEVVELLKSSPTRRERCRPDLVVPAHQRDLLPLADTGPAPGKEKRLDAAAQKRVTLADFMSAA